MTGRARARARGRPPGQETAVPSVGAASAQQAFSSHPSGHQQPQQPSLPPTLSEEFGGRGRQRGPQSVPKPLGLQISAGFQELSLADRGGRRRDFHDLGVNTRQAIEHVRESKTGSSGIMIKLIANYFRLTSRPKWALYQYHIGYNPEMEARRLRSALLFQHEELIGKTHAFDGSILFLPKKLGNKVTEVFSKTRNGEDVKITITLTNELPPSSPTCLQFYNIIFRRLLKMMNLQQIGRNYYNPNDPVSIPNHRLMVWPGFSSSILQYEESIMLCADVSYKILRSETVLDFMYSLYYQVEEQRFRDACAKELIGLIILTKYNNRTYRVDDIDWDANPQCTFRRADGSEISYVDYYKRQYNQEITDLNQPVLISQSRRKRGSMISGPVVLIPELCYLTGLTEKMRNDFNMMKDLAIHTRLPPERRQCEIGRLIDYIQKDDGVQKELRDWGLSFDSKLLSFTGRVVQSEKILQAGNVFDYNPQFADWSRETRVAPLISAKPLDNWLLIYTRRNYDTANTLLQNLFKVTPSMGIRMNKATMIEVDDRTEAYLRVLQQSITPDTNILKQVMIVGIDCYHDTSAGKQSIAGFVASLNQTMTRWFSRCVVQTRGQELVDGLKACLQTALRDWFKWNKYLPSRIIVYRDGVGDGQLHTLVNYEVPQFLDCLKTVGKDYNPKLTVIVVKKRVNTRFFAQSGGGLKNPPPGTVVDVEVTRPEWYDFFIVSQAVRNGCVAPTHYNVIYDTSKLKPDHVQRLTYKLCHMYYNWSVLDSHRTCCNKQAECNHTQELLKTQLHEAVSNLNKL
uniref:Piwi like RNA-mediated gene silencing 1 n=1 Tax=Anser brachyrhynchus TaxID=132585 RepID=A0A8B9CLL1_9AVES